MRSKLTIGPLIGISLLLALLLGACGPSAAPPVPTRAPAPTFTPTPEGPPLPADPAVEQPPAEAVVEELPPAEPTPTDTPPPPPPPTPTPAAEVIINTNMNVRGGPGTNYNIIGAASAGERYVVTGRNDAGNWWQIDFQGQNGWVF
ncbi:MAG: SH3 domain-containing protein, partial [Chloroflexota bacterium]|nr:SH3 domain-containing protein [Chloroflexota bacterium]